MLFITSGQTPEPKLPHRRTAPPASQHSDPRLWRVPGELTTLVLAGLPPELAPLHAGVPLGSHATAAIHHYSEWLTREFGNVCT